MEIGERVAIGGLAEELEVECPFAEEGGESLSEEGESVAKDDRATREQANDGGKLGANLLSGSPGAEGTVGGPYPPPAQEPVPRIDTPRTGVKAFVPDGGGYEHGDFPFIVAAHHCLPGKASLEPSFLKKLMTKGESVQVKGKVRKIKNHIGYNVNGAHNGVWLPGNYAIRGDGDTAPLNQTWSELGNSPWCKTYVAGVTATTGSQFHDAHDEYSRAVEKLLNKIEACINLHECRLCAEKTEIPPPYVIKNRLYALSGYLRQQLQGPPGCWRRPWFASDRWRKAAFSERAEWKDFDRTYRMAVNRRAAPGKSSTGA